MRVVIDLDRIGDRVEGTVAADDPAVPPAPFSGWAELLHVLGARLPEAATGCTPAAPTTGATPPPTAPR